MSITCLGQTAPALVPVTSIAGPTPSNVYAVDVNNDGLTDIILDSTEPDTTGVSFSVSLNTGGGVFAPPVAYKINSTNWTPLTWGDFNNDGNVDIAVLLTGTNQVDVYLGNGDGTFQDPITTTVNLPSGLILGGYGPQMTIVAADFNHDGNQDLMVTANDGNNTGGIWEVYLLEGDGTGHFTNPTAVYQPTTGWAVQSIVGGDFDIDGNADVTLLEGIYCGGTYLCESNVVTLFGSGGTNFTPVDVTTVDGDMTLGAADLNTDGATDLYGYQYSNSNGLGDGAIDPGGPRLAVFLGHYDRKFSYLYTPTSTYGAINVGAPFAVADFDGSFDWTLAALSVTYSESGEPSTQLIYLFNPATTDGVIGFGPSPAGTSGYQIGPVVGNFNGDTKPDIAVVQSPEDTSAATTLAAGLNVNTTGFYGECDYPSSGQGIHLCNPTSQPVSGPFTFEASANSFGQLRKIELWVDGVKLDEQHFIWGQSGYFNYTSNPSPGTHYATIYAANIDNTLQHYDFNFTVGNN
ncbi:MAG: VCBS repeat-containing protein [Terracidiphilus sp.]